MVVGALAIGVGAGLVVAVIGFAAMRAAVASLEGDVERITDGAVVRSAHGVLLFPATDDVAIYNDSRVRTGTLERAVIDHGLIDDDELRIPDDEVWIERTRGAHRDVTPMSRFRVKRSEMEFVVDEPRRGELLAAMNRSDGEVQTCRATFSERGGRTGVRVDYEEDCGCRGWAEYEIAPDRAGVVMRERGYFHHRDALGTIVTGAMISLGAALVCGVVVFAVGLRWGWRRLV